MKWISFILSFYMLVLAVLPCADEYIACNPNENSSYTTSSDTHEHQQESDHCSPFCVCSCCGIPIITASSTLNSFISLPLIKEKPVFPTHLVGIIHHQENWKPPRS